MCAKQVSMELDSPVKVYSLYCQTVLTSFIHADIDECVIGEHNCSENANCTNTHGSYECQCLSSFVGDGHQCSCK